ncbi:MAG: hypothetical protein HY272_13770 [Gammaproteobacteria bacterium]|nr:hypothetical protein [Gammaproteobacteria bacterium]
MQTRAQFICLAVITIFTLGCTAQPTLQIPLSSGSASSIKSSSVILITNNQITTNIDRSNVASLMGGGLLFSLVDISRDGIRQASANNLTNSLLSQWIQYDLKTHLATALQPMLDSTSWLNVKNIKRLSPNEAVSSETACNNINTDACVLIGTISYFDEPLNSITLKSEINVFIKDSRAQFIKDPAYKNTVLSVYLLPGNTTSKDQAISTWSANNAHHLREAFDQGIAETTRRLAKGISDPYRKGWVN